VTDVDEAQRLQDDEGLADRGAADAKAVRELALRWKLVARSHPGLPDELTEPLPNVDVETAPFERAQGFD
jgi:hypothetical protein